MPFMHTATLPTGAKFSRKRAERAIRFIERATVHTKSVWARKPFLLYDWQKGTATEEKISEEVTRWHVTGIVMPLLGAVKWSPHWQQWVRQFNVAWIELARKNGKSELLAALGLYFLIADGEWSAEIIGAASDKRQASQVFNVAKNMIRLSPVLAKLERDGDLEVIDSRKRIVYKKTMSVYEVVSADYMANLGANPYVILFDEVLAQPGRQLWDALAQGFGTRPNQLLIGITTAGPDKESFAYSEHEMSIQAVRNPDDYPARFSFVAYTDTDVDWTDETFWGEANPGLGTIIDIDQLRGERDAAINSGDYAAQANFKIFRLNQWGTSANRWLDMLVWDDSELNAGYFHESEISDVVAYGGFDLASTTDFIAWTIVFPAEDRVMVKTRFWLTELALKTKHKRNKERIQQWIDAGHITLVPGDAYNYDDIREAIMDDIEKYKIRMIGYDQWQAPAVVTHIESKSNVTMIKIPQTTTRMNPGSKELTRLMGLRQFTVNQNPVMRWNAANAMYKSDREGNIKPDKDSSQSSIDGISSLVIALTVFVSAPPPQEVSLFVLDTCPSCDSEELIENGNYRRCRDCGYSWTEED